MPGLDRAHDTGGAGRALAEDTRRPPGEGPAPRSSSWMAIAWVISKASMEEVHRKREREGRGFWTVTLPKKKEKKNSVLRNRTKSHWCVLQMARHFQERDKTKTQIYV